MRGERISCSKKLVICIAFSMGGFLIVQMVLSVKNLFETATRIPITRAGFDSHFFQSHADPGNQHEDSNIRVNKPTGVLITESQLRYTRQFLRSAISEVSLMSFPDHLKEYVMYDLTAKKALLDLHEWLYTNQYPLPLFKDRLVAGETSDGPRVCVGITSANRPHAPFSYLIQTVSALLNRLNYAKYKKDVYIHVFNIDEGEHEEAKVVSQFVPVTNLERISSDKGDRLPRKYQENLDNADVLRQMHSLNCQYPIFIEDDALAKENWMDSVMLAIHEMEQFDFERKAIVPISARPWLMVKLYCAREHAPDLAPKEGVNTSYFQRWNTVAMMFNREFVLNVSNHLEIVVRNAIAREKFDLPIAKDEDIDNWRNKTGLTGMCFEPVIFQHTGVYSSVQSRIPDQKSVNLWYMKSMYFQSHEQPVSFNESHWIHLVT